MQALGTACGINHIGLDLLFQDTFRAIVATSYPFSGCFLISCAFFPDMYMCTTPGSGRLRSADTQLGVVSWRLLKLKVCSQKGISQRWSYSRRASLHGFASLLMRAAVDHLAVSLACTAWTSLHCQFVQKIATKCILMTLTSL